MPRKVRVLTVALGPTEARYRSTAEMNRDLACRYVRAGGRQGADLVCLPEDFLTPPHAPLRDRHVEPLDGPTFAALSRLAKVYRLWVVACWYVPHHRLAGYVENSAVVINRSGDIAGRYVKVHPTIVECERARSVPGNQTAVIETDFGRLGLAICYDIGWPEHWASLACAGAELVVWPSAYDGGFPLRSYAWTHRYRIVSSVLSDNARVIDITGRPIAGTSRWHPFAYANLDLDKQLFHINYHEETLVRMQEEIGESIVVESFGEEGVFTVESINPSIPVSSIMSHYGLESFHDYHARAESVQKQYRRRTRADGVHRAGSDSPDLLS